MVIFICGSQKIDITTVRGLIASLLHIHTPLRGFCYKNFMIRNDQYLYFFLFNFVYFILENFTGESSTVIFTVATVFGKM